MRINADFTKKAMVIPHADDWVVSPESGVDRLMLDRIGDEVARATSLVRYAPDSSFTRHEHAMGEEFLVLAGVFADEHADYPAGTYVRNPPGSGHSPYSKRGCRILVKLRQFDPADLAHVVVDTNDQTLWQADTSAGVDRLPLHQFGSETVSMLRIAAGRHFKLAGAVGGAEMLLVQGALAYGKKKLGEESWLRIPAASTSDLLATSDCVVWEKTGHLPGASPDHS